MSKKKRVAPSKKSNPILIYIGIGILAIAAVAIYSSSIPATEKQPDIFQPEPGKVKIVEFMKFDCIHCYNLHKEKPGILEKYGGNVSITYIPIVFPGQSTKSIEAYIIAERMGRAEAMGDALFKAKFVDNMDVMESTIVLKNVATSVGLGADFKSKLEGGEAKKAAQSNLALMTKYNVQGTPTVYINGKLLELKTNDLAKDLDTAIGSLLN
ncbi:MAG: thioredoxin domain-containing protein [Candidatus Methanoperedens sp.]|nr:thioredoxin domain-containing protein [Candidatus Methanoperedens sp.]